MRERERLMVAWGRGRKIMESEGQWFLFEMMKMF